MDKSWILCCQLNAALLLLFPLAWAIAYYQEYTRKLATCGFLPPKPGPWEFRFVHILAWLVTSIQVGRVGWRGAENLKLLPANGVLVVANHVSYTDACLVMRTLGKPARYMAGSEVMHMVGGLIGRLIVMCGGFAISRKSSSGRATEVAADILQSGQTLVIFPEGACQFDGEMSRFRNGAAVVAIAAEQLGEPITILPIHIHYNKLPGNWIRGLSPNASILHMIRNFLHYRQGATISIGTPFSSNELSGDDINNASLTIMRKVQDCAAGA